MFGDVAVQWRNQSNLIFVSYCIFGWFNKNFVDFHSALTSQVSVRGGFRQFIFKHDAQADKLTSWQAYKPRSPQADKFTRYQTHRWKEDMVTWLLHICYVETSEFLRCGETSDWRLVPPGAPWTPWCPHNPWYVILGHSQSSWVIISHIWPIWSE